MSAMFRKSFADIRRRRLQTSVITLVTILSALASTLALNLLVESDAPYDHAFEQANGPHLVLTLDGARASVADLATTKRAAGVVQAAGPWQVVQTGLQFSSPAGAPGPGGRITLGMTLVGRDRPDTSIDRLTMVAGRWARLPGEVVISRNIASDLRVSLGDSLTVPDVPAAPILTVVGVAASINRYPDGWMAPEQVPSLTSAGKPEQWVMEYRVSNPSSATGLAQTVGGIAGLLPAGSVLNSMSWLDVKKSADLTTAVMVPFLIAFSAFALLAAAFVISNVIAGVVVADRRQIGIMKSVGFTPAQVTGVLVVEVLTPVLLGCAIGVPLGTVASQPFLQQTAQALGLPAPFSASIPVDLSVFAIVFTIAAAAAAWPAARAGRLSSVAGISVGTGPSGARGGRLITMLNSLPLAAPFRFGLADLVAHPVRAAMTASAVTLGAATVVFAIGLNLSLGLVAERLIRDQEVQVVVNAGPETTPTQVEELIHAAPGTSRFVGEGQDQVRVSGVAPPIPYFGYDRPSEWLGYAMISGRWFRAPGEVVAPSHLIDVAGLVVGHTFTASINGHPLQLRLVGEVFDQTGDDLLLRGALSTVAQLDPKVATDHFEVQLAPGVDPRQYASDLQASRSSLLDVRTVSNSGIHTAFILINDVIAGLAIVLTGIAVAGVLNTVVLATRERRRETAILKAIGMDPMQVIAMVVSSTALIGLVAGALGVPLGLMLHHQILTSMAEIATNTRVPASFYNVLGNGPLVGLALAGPLIAAIGAWFPAHWAAHERVMAVLQAE
jgi:putative ABC transport system permease protein